MYDVIVQYDMYKSGARKGFECKKAHKTNSNICRDFLD